MKTLILMLWSIGIIAGISLLFDMFDVRVTAAQLLLGVICGLMIGAVIEALKRN